jgi:hypothetical protein
MLTERDHSLRAFLGEQLSAVVTFDNRFWRTLRGIPRPGFLTAEYVAGRRRAYLGPVQLFLVFSVVFFFASPALGFMTTGLGQFLNDPIVGRLANPLVEAEAARRGLEMEAFTAEFVRVMDAQKRFMVMLAIPIFAVVMKLLYRRRSYVEHLAFATHALGSLLVLLVAYIFVFVVGMMLVRSWLGLPQTWRLSGLQLVLLIATPVLPFVWLALRRVYGGTRASLALKTLLASVGLAVSLLAYEHLLFFTTMLALRLGA